MQKSLIFSLEPRSRHTFCFSKKKNLGPQGPWGVPGRTPWAPGAQGRIVGVPGRTPWAQGAQGAPKFEISIKRPGRLMAQDYGAIKRP